MTKEDVLKNLKKLIDVKVWDDWDIYSAFEDFEENGEHKVWFSKSDNSGYDYIAYIDTECSTQFLIKTNDKRIITDVWIA